MTRASTVLLGLLASFFVLSCSQAALQPFSASHEDEDGGQKSLEKKSSPRRRRSIFPNPITLDSCSSNSGSDAGSSSSSSSTTTTTATSLSPGDLAELRDVLRSALSSGEQPSADEVLQAVRYARNLVRNRALFLTLSLQLQNASQQFQGQPGLLHYYASAAAALFSAPPVVVGSGVFYDRDRHYANWWVH